MYWLTNSLKNLYRSRRRYIPLAMMYFILVCGAAAGVYTFIRMNTATEAILRE